MKKISLLLLLASTFLTINTTSASVVTWQPTNADVNFSYNTLAGYSLALFDVDDFLGAQSSPLSLNTGTGFDTISITSSGSDYDATSMVTANSISLLNSDTYVLAITDGFDWFEPLSWYEVAPNSNIFSISFATGQVTSFDSAVAAVPAPAALVLFSSGLLGLAGVVRRKR